MESDQYGPKPTHEECQQIAEFLQGFSNPVRIRIMCALRDGEKSVGEIAVLVGAKQSNISQQLQILMTKGYVTRRREERNILYRASRTELYRIMEHICTFVCHGDLSCNM
jgi:ArsR family transcriptional regulator